MLNTFLKAKLIFQIIISFCALLFNNVNYAYANYNIPAGTIYSQDNTSETFTQSVASFTMQEGNDGAKGCNSVLAKDYQHQLCATVSDKVDNYQASFNLFQPLLNAKKNFPTPNTNHDTVDLEVANTWRNPIYSGTVIKGPFIDVDRAGVLYATANINAEVYLVTTIPVKKYMGFENSSVHKDDIMFTVELVSDNVILAKNDIEFKYFKCEDGLYFKENEKIFARYEVVSGQYKKWRLGLLRCYFEPQQVIFGASINSPKNNIEIRIVLKDSPAEMSVFSTTIRHVY